MANNKISYPVQGAPFRDILVPVAFTWNGSTATASTQKANARYVASIVRTSAGLCTIAFKENMGALLGASIVTQTANGTNDTTAGKFLLGAYSATNKTLAVQCFNAIVAGAATDPGAAVTLYLALQFSADARD